MSIKQPYEAGIDICDRCGKEYEAGNGGVHAYMFGSDYCLGCLEALGLTTCAYCGIVCAKEMLHEEDDYCDLCHDKYTLGLGE